MFDSLSSLGGPAAYLGVGAVAALEASAFVGLVIPGELALLTGGHIAQQGHAALGLMMVAAAIGAIVGDSIGYEIGRHFGLALQRSRLGRKVGDERWQRAEAYLDAKGGRAIFAGRFIGVLRALVPAVAGTARMPYRRFLTWNAAGAVIWALALVLAGHAAGSSYKRVERYAGAAGLVLLGAGVAIALVVAAARWIGQHPDQVRGFTTRQVQRPRVASLAGRYQAQLRFLTDRFRTGNALGLALTAPLALLAAAGWAFAALLQDVLGRDDRNRWKITALLAAAARGSPTIGVPPQALGQPRRHHSVAAATHAIEDTAVAANARCFHGPAATVRSAGRYAGKVARPWPTLQPTPLPPWNCLVTG